MCGIAGTLSLRRGGVVDERIVERMTATLRHRGPDSNTVWSGGNVALGHARLAIIDVAGGAQPLTDEAGSVSVIVNGEIFNYVELRAALVARGHRFATSSDSEVVPHLYEDLGTALLDELNGDFAFALWDGERQALLLARDRVGVRPLFYTVVDGTLLFASEVKSLLTDPRVSAEPDLEALDQVFTYWSPLPGRTMFRGIREVPPGHYLLAMPGIEQPVVGRYWDLDFSEPSPFDTAGAAEQLRQLLDDATRIRLRADVRVGAYLSGGLDSTAIAALARTHVGEDMETFSVAFDHADYDERRFQAEVAEALGTRHHMITCSSGDIAEAFPDVVRHAEMPLLRTAPAPLFLLSALVRSHGMKVVLTGEGADELLGGYDIFKESIVRRFWARAPQSTLRPLLLDRLYPWMPQVQRAPGGIRRAFFAQGLTDVDDPTYSHGPRWRTTARLKRLFSAQVAAELRGYDSREELVASLPPTFASWDGLSKAQYLEMATLLSPYLLASQGDRMAMAHGVEGRFPFLDHRVIELASRIPSRLRIAGLQEKYVLKHATRDLVPDVVRRRPKQSYRAPVAAVFSGPTAPAYAEELLSEATVRSVGLFDARAVAALRHKCATRQGLSESDGMALVGVLSTHLWHETFVGGRGHWARADGTVKPYAMRSQERFAATGTA